MLLGAALLAVIAIVAIILAIVPSSHAPVEAQPVATEAASAATQAPQSTLMAQPEPTAQAPLPTMVAEYTILEDKLTTDHALGLPESPRVDDSYFNDCLFVGDSVSEKLRLFVSQERKENPTYLGNARFITASSFSARNALREVTETSLHPSWQGQKMRLEDLIPLTGATKVYIMLGMNDAGISGYKEAAQNLMTLIGLIQEKSPDIQIFIETATPRLSGTHPTTKQLLAFNLQVNEYVQQLGDPNVNIVDVAFVMRDEEGKLKAEYCSDPDNMAIHFTNAGCRAWVDYLYTHALVAS